MPKTRSKRRFRNTLCAYYKSHVPHYLKKPTVISKGVEIISNRGLKLARQTLFDTKVVNRYDESLGEQRDVKVKDLNASGNSDGSQPSTSDQPADQASSSSTAILFMNGGPTCESVATGVIYEQFEVLRTLLCEDDDVVPELPTEDDDDYHDDATVPSGNKPSAAAKENETSQSNACGLNCRNECHKNLTVGISYFSDVDMCEECVANIEHACLQCQLAYMTKKCVGKSNSSSFTG